MGSCPDCGCRTSDGVCSNCQEELYILREQADYINSLTPEFLAKANEQEKFLKDTKRFDVNH